MLQQQSILDSSTHSYINVEESKFKDNIVQKLGGEDQLQFLIISFCERIRNDRLLKKVYRGLDEKSLIALQKNMILTSFLDVSPSEYELLRNKLLLRYHFIFQEGVPKKHYEALEENFVCAMRDAWVDEEVLELCKTLFGTSIRSFLEDCSSMTLSSKIEQTAYINLVSYRMTGQIMCSQ
ncbi:MAG: hypothetical protein SGBAC_007373 [Bacillariaceae sp.]